MFWYYFVCAPIIYIYMCVCVALPARLLAYLLVKMHMNLLTKLCV